MSPLPPLNSRIRDLMNEKTGKSSRNVSSFAQMISEGRDKPIVQQRLDKIFNEESPSAVAVDIIEAIVLRFPDIDAYTLITGKEKSGTIVPDYVSNLRKQISSALVSLQEAMKTLPGPMGPEIGAAGDPAFRKAGKTKRTERQ